MNGLSLPTPTATPPSTATSQTRGDRPPPGCSSDRTGRTPPRDLTLKLDRHERAQPAHAHRHAAFDCYLPDTRRSPAPPLFVLTPAGDAIGAGLGAQSRGSPQCEKALVSANPALHNHRLTATEKRRNPEWERSWSANSSLSTGSATTRLEPRAPTVEVGRSRST